MYDVMCVCARVRSGILHFHPQQHRRVARPHNGLQPPREPSRTHRRRAAHDAFLRDESPQVDTALLQEPASVHRRDSPSDQRPLRLGWTSRRQLQRDDHDHMSAAAVQRGGLHRLRHERQPDWHHGLPRTVCEPRGFADVLFATETRGCRVLVQVRLNQRWVSLAVEPKREAL